MNKIFKHRYLLFSCFILIAACKDKPVNQEKFLQQQNVQLSKPHFFTENTMIQESSQLIIGEVENGATIRYTTNGKDPDENSEIYKGQITVNQSCTVKAMVFHLDWKPSDISAIDFLMAGVQPESISLLSQINEKYKGGGVPILIDNQRGTQIFSTVKWIGVDGPISAEVDFGRSISLTSIKICYLSDVGNWIFPPKSIVLYGSSDGKNYKEITSKQFAIETKVSAPGLKIATIDLNDEVKTVKILVENLDTIPEWHDGKGTPAWLFMDEWIFN